MILRRGVGASLVAVPHGELAIPAWFFFWLDVQHKAVDAQGCLLSWPKLGLEYPTTPFSFVAEGWPSRWSFFESGAFAMTWPQVSHLTFEMT